MQQLHLKWQKQVTKNDKANTVPALIKSLLEADLPQFQGWVCQGSTWSSVWEQRFGLGFDAAVVEISHYLRVHTAREGLPDPLPLFPLKGHVWNSLSCSRVIWGQIEVVKGLWLKRKLSVYTPRVCVITSLINEFTTLIYSKGLLIEHFHPNITVQASFVFKMLSLGF